MGSRNEDDVVEGHYSVHSIASIAGSVYRAATNRIGCVYQDDELEDYVLCVFLVLKIQGS